MAQMGVESQTSVPMFSHPMALAATIITFHLRVLLAHEFTYGVMNAYPDAYYACALGDLLERAADRVQLDGSQHRPAGLLRSTCYVVD